VDWTLDSLQVARNVWPDRNEEKPYKLQHLHRDLVLRPSNRPALPDGYWHDASHDVSALIELVSLDQFKAVVNSDTFYVVWLQFVRMWDSRFLAIESLLQQPQIADRIEAEEHPLPRHLPSAARRWSVCLNTNVCRSGARGGRLGNRR